MLKSWKNQNLGFSLIRLWLGITWIYGGWNKASDSGFLNPASNHYIGAQINGMLGSSPISFFLRHLIEHASFIGWAIMLGEFAIGIATLLGFASELAALAGFGTSILLWLSVSWSVHPYFLGSDTAYAILWLAYFVYLRSEARKIPARRSLVTVVTSNLSRRGFLQIGTGGIVTIIAAALGRSFQTPIAIPTKATPIATVGEIPVGGVKAFTAADGTAAMLFRTKVGYFAYSRICTHQGCTVNFDQATGHLLCPCHGATYDPNNGAAVIAGPAPKPLASIKVVVSGNNILQA
jgi:thiosulfate dehydrogenase [quinone] large subunit